MPKKGYKQTDEHRHKISESHKGLKPSKATRMKISKANKGRTFSPEIREKVREAMMGNTNGKGSKATEKHRRNISRAQKRRHKARKAAGIVGYNTGENKKLKNPENSLDT